MSLWIVSEDATPYTALESPTAELALAEALARVDVDSQRARSYSTWLLEVSVVCESSGEAGSAYVEVPPREPLCPTHGVHAWLPVLAGSGVQVESCKRCACVRELDERAMGPGGQRYTRVTYRAATPPTGYQ
jgi:hypothetical protein